MNGSWRCPLFDPGFGATLCPARNRASNRPSNGVESGPVQFDIRELGAVCRLSTPGQMERMALRRYGFAPGTGLYTDMNAIRQDEDLDNLHSVYVDQWDLGKGHRPGITGIWTICGETVLSIVSPAENQSVLSLQYPVLDHLIDSDVYFISSQELADRYPGLTPHEREDRLPRRRGLSLSPRSAANSGTAGLMMAGHPTTTIGGSSGDILVWYPVLNRAVGISSMGIGWTRRASAPSLKRLAARNGGTWISHKRLLAGELPPDHGRRHRPV